MSEPAEESGRSEQAELTSETVTSEEMAAIDLNCEYHGLSRLQLMENAGMALAQEILSLNPSGVTIFAGLGNNGGDAFVASRILSGRVGRIRIYLLGRAGEIKTDIARRNFELAKLAGVDVVEIRDSKDLEKVELFDCIVDAMLGTGVRGRLREPYASAVELINSSEGRKVAVDVPTGLNPDTGECVDAVRADLTVTFHRAKPGLLKAKQFVGRLVVRSIGIPPGIERLAGPGDVRIAFRRSEFGHKGTHGRVLVAGGGPYTGAPALAALAALKAGADLSFVAVPAKIREVVSSFSPELIVRGFERTGEIEERFDVAVVGMGMDERVAREVVRVLSERCERLVLDASAIPCVEQLSSNSDSVVITPHRGELRKHFGLEISQNPGEDELESLRKLARDINAVILLKGKIDVVTDGRRIKLNRSGNAGMTAGGTGDVLAGVCGAFLASTSAFKAAVSAAFVTGFAGDISFEEKGYCITAMDVLEKLPVAIKRCLEFG